MHPYTTTLLVQDRIDTFLREADQDRLAAAVKPGTARTGGLRGLIHQVHIPEHAPRSRSATAHAE